MCKGSESEGKRKMRQERELEIKSAVCNFTRKSTQLSHGISLDKLHEITPSGSSLVDMGFT